MNQRMEQAIRRIAIAFGALLAGLIIVWLLVLALGVSVRLDVLRDPIETAASAALGREVRISGAIELRPTIGPGIVMHGMRIASPEGQAGAALLQADQVEARLGFLALLRGRIHLDRLLLQDVRINLETRQDSSRNWRHAAARTATGQAPSPMLPGSETPLIRQRDLQDLSLRNIVLNYRDERMDQHTQLEFDEITGRFIADEPLHLVIQGTLQQHAYSASLTGGSLSKLLAQAEPWPLHATATLAGTNLILNGALDLPRRGKGLALDFELQGNWFKDLEPAMPDARLPVTGASVMRGRLETVDGKALITLREMTRAPLEISDVRLTLSVRDGRLSAPLSVTIAGVPFHGNVVLDGQDDAPVLALVLAATDADAGRLAESLAGIEGIQGRFNHIAFNAATSAAGMSAFPNGLDLGLNITGARLSYGHVADGRPVDFTLDDLALSIPGGKDVSVTADGTLLNEPFEFEFTGGRLELLLKQEGWPVALSATGAGSRLGIKGRLADVRSKTDTHLNLDLSGKRLGDLANWFGVSPCAAASYTARGQLVFSENTRRLRFLSARIGKTQLNGELDWSRDERIPLLHAVIHFDELDPADLEGLTPPVRFGAGDDSENGIRIGMSVLPRDIEITEADIELDIAHITLKLLDITDVSFSRQIRGGKVKRSPFTAQLGNTRFQGFLEPSGATTDMVFIFGENDKDSGNRLKQLFSTAIRWTGNAAIVPLHWIFTQKLAGEVTTDCAAASGQPPDPPQQ